MSEAPTIQTSEEYRLAVQALTRRSRPPWLLRLLMNALEGYRQKRKMGWSRPQNKYGVTTHHAYELEVERNAALFKSALPTLLQECPDTDDTEARFVRDVTSDPKARGFVFVHDIVEDDVRWEGATLSLGRVAASSPRHRDRLDLVVERRVVGGVSQGALRLRAYIDPYVPPGEGTWPRSHTRPVAGTAAEELFRALATYHAEFRSDASRAWSHWTQDYIDYFGPRQEPVASTAFPTPIDDAHRALDSSVRATGGRQPRVDVDSVTAA